MSLPLESSSAPGRLLAVTCVPDQFAGGRRGACPGKAPGGRPPDGPGNMRAGLIGPPSRGRGPPGAHRGVDIGRSRDRGAGQQLSRRIFAGFAIPGAGPVSSLRPGPGTRARAGRIGPRCSRRMQPECAAGREKSHDRDCFSGQEGPVAYLRSGGPPGGSSGRRSRVRGERQDAAVVSTATARSRRCQQRPTRRTYSPDLLGGANSPGG